MLEKRHEKVIPPHRFARRLLFWCLITLGLQVVSLLVGIVGYHYLESMPWIDALLNAAMILGGMGEIDVLHTMGGKLFASFYAMYSGMFLVVCGGLLMVPIFHRVLHHLHADK